MTKAAAPKGKKRRKKFSPDLRRQVLPPIDEAIARRQKDTVLALASRGPSAAVALELGLTAIILADHLSALFEAQNPLPRAIACRAGCDFCCYNQIEVTPPEALLLGDYAAKHFPGPAHEKLQERVARSAAAKAGKTKKEIARLRHHLPCPFLEAGRCTVYAVRPLVCRAMHALDARQCQAALESGRLLAADHYAHRRVFTMSVVHGLSAGCRELGWEAGYADLDRALLAFWARPDPMGDWLKGEKIFSGQPAD